MKHIALTQGQVALVDDEDYEELSRYRWRAQWNPCTCSFYAGRTVRLPDGKRTTEQMQRHILGLKLGDPRQGDHIDHDTLDNRRANIRIVTRSENQHNSRRKGYCWDKSRQKYMARIRIAGTEKHLGRFDTPTEASAAYLAAKRTYHPSAPCLATV